MKKTAFLTLLMFALPAMAHPGHPDASGILAGLAHPFTGIDHLLAMLGLGLWSRQQHGGRLLVPAFLAMLLAGALLRSGLEIEMGLAATVALTGVLLAAAVRLPLGAALALLGLFAFLHGQAHGRELSGVAAMAGFMLASGALLAIGRVAGGLRVNRIAGAAIGAAGLCLLAGVA